jgi:hypothetical protein
VIRLDSKPATIPDLRAFEDRLGLALPPSYRAFLVEHNGGFPSPDLLEAPWGGTLFVQRFLPIGADGIDRALRLFPAWRQTRLLPIADCAGNYLLLSLDDGRVCYWHHERDAADAGQTDLPTVCDDFRDIWRLFVEEEHGGRESIEDLGRLGDPGVVDSFLVGGAIDRLSEDGRTLAMEAARHGQRLLLEVCLTKGARPSGVLHHAVAAGDRGMIEFLLDDIGVDINEINGRGRRPLSYAFLDPRMQTWLRERGARE